ncbi:MAG: hypothetical protein Kow0098_05420 [Ignavibacteriaceae bacterium]
MEKDIIQLLIGLRKSQGELSKLLHKLIKTAKLNIDPSWISIILLIYREKEVNVKIIAGTLALTHPAVVQLLSKMEKLHFIKTSKSEIDGRIKLVRLTETGEKLAADLQVITELIRNEFEELNGKIIEDFTVQLKNLSALLGSASITNTTIRKLKAVQLKRVKVTTFKPELLKYFNELISECAKENVKPMEIRGRMLKNPVNEVIQKGGEVFFAYIDDDIAGTCAVLKISDNIYELAEITVKKSARGRQAGKKLALAAIGFAASNKAESLIVYVNEQPEAAFRLFDSLGFKLSEDGELTENEKQKLIKMQLVLS